VTAIGNDYGADEVFARQVRAHGRPGDVLVVLSTSGGSPNVVAAAEAGADAGLTVWALTGRAPNSLVRVADEAIAVPSTYTPTVQELHLVAVHMLCAAIDASAHNVISLAAAREARAL
jgi:phosphoheptose isomerase